MLMPSGSTFEPEALGDREQLITISSELERDIVLRVERTTSHDDVVTAAQTTSLENFRRLFPNEVVGTDRPASLRCVYFLASEAVFDDSILRIIGDNELYGEIQKLFERLRAMVADHGGSLVKTIGNGGLAVFVDGNDALEAGQKLLNTISSPLQIRAAIHSESAVLANVNGTVEYFGKTVQETLEHAKHGEPDSILITQGVAAPSICPLQRDPLTSSSGNC